MSKDCLHTADVSPTSTSAAAELTTVVDNNPCKRIRVEQLTRSDDRRILLLFVGPQRAAAMRQVAAELGWEVTVADFRATPSMDLLDIDVWEALMARVHEGCYQAIYARPPSGTFNEQLRGHEVHEVEGLRDLSLDDKKRVKVGNLLASRAVEALEAVALQDGLWAVEQPARRARRPTMFALPVFSNLAQLAGATFRRLTHGDPGRSMEVEILGNLDMSRWPGPDTQNSLGLLNQLVAQTIAKNFETRQGMESAGERGCKRARPSRTLDPSGNPLPQFRDRPINPNPESRAYVGGMRRPYHSLIDTSLINLGVQIRNIIEAYFREHTHLPGVYLAAIGNKDAPHFPGGDVHCNEIRSRIASMLVRHLPADSKPDLTELHDNPPDTCLKANFLKLRLQASCRRPCTKDRSLAARRGAGGTHLPPGAAGILEQVKDLHESQDPATLFTDHTSFRNYHGVEESEEAAKALQGYIDKGYLTPFDTLEECTQAVGGRPVLSKLGCIVKTKVNDLGQAVTKVRIILDAKQSGVTSATERRFKNELPRVTDAVSDLLHLMSSLKPGETVVQFVADVVDAFWLVPLAPCERRFFVAKFRGRYLVFCRTAQGSRTAPLTFAALMATAARLMQSVLLRNHLSEDIWQDSRLEVYVDDPWAAIKGTPAEVDTITAVLLCAWEIMGFPIAYHKACRARSLKWIGMVISVHADKVTVEVPEDKLADVRNLVQAFLKGNVIAIKDMRSFVGKCMAIASILHVWKPFISQFYAAMGTPGNAPPGCLWTQQVKPVLLWMQSFFAFRSVDTWCKRSWSLTEFMKHPSHVTITCDASPWGMGASTGSKIIQGP